MRRRLLQSLACLGEGAPGLQMLILHGSRARGTAHARSDWDFAYEAEAGFDADGLLAALADILKADRIDLVDLDHAGALLRHRVASDGVVLFSLTPGRFDRFRLAAARLPESSSGLVAATDASDAFRRLQSTRIIDAPLADRLVRAAGFCNVVAQAYERLEMARVFQAATDGPADLRAFVAAGAVRALPPA